MFNEEESEKEDKKTEEKNLDRQKFLRIIAVVVSISALIFLIYYKLSHPEFPIYLLIIFIVIIGLIFGAFFFGKKIFDWFNKINKKQSDDEIPKAISKEEAFEMCRKELLKPEYANHLLGWEDVSLTATGKLKPNTILVAKLTDLVYDNEDNFYFFINLNYPEKNVLLRNPTNADIREQKRNLGLQPTDEPDEESSSWVDPISGRIFTQNKKTHGKKNKKEKKGDLE